MVSLVSDLGGDICDRSFRHGPHPMKVCITGASGLGLLVNRARRSEGVFECLVKTVSREMEKKRGPYCDKKATAQKPIPRVFWIV